MADVLDIECDDSEFQNELMDTGSVEKGAKSFEKKFPKKEQPPNKHEEENLESGELPHSPSSHHHESQAVKRKGRGFEKRKFSTQHLKRVAIQVIFSPMNSQINSRHVGRIRARGRATI